MRELIIDWLDKVEVWAEGFGDTLEVVDKLLPDTKPECDGTLFCICQRYKCEGRIKSVNTFWKELKQL